MFILEYGELFAILTPSICLVKFEGLFFCRMGKELIFLIFELCILFSYGFSFLYGQNLNSNFHTPFQKCWETATFYSDFTASDNENNIFLPLSLGKLKAINRDNLDIWNIELGGEIISKPIYQNERLFILSKIVEKENSAEAEYFVSAVNTNSGVIEWKKEFKSIGDPFFLLYQGNPLVVTRRHSISQQNIFSDFKIFGAFNGNILSDIKPRAGVKRLLFSDGERILFVTSDDKLLVFSLSDEKLTSLKIPAKDIQRGLIYEKAVLLADAKGNLFAVDLSGSKKVRKVKFGAKITGLVFFQDKILVSSLDNFLYSISPDGNKVLWKKRMSGRVTVKPAFNRGAVVAFSQGDNFIQFINPEDGKTFNQISVAEDEEVTGNLVFINDMAVAQTNKGLRAYGSDHCKNVTAAEK